MDRALPSNERGWGYFNGNLKDILITLKWEIFSFVHFFQNSDSVFMDAQVNQRKVAGHLLEKFEDAKALFESFPDKLRGSLETYYPSK